MNNAQSSLTRPVLVLTAAALCAPLAHAAQTVVEDDYAAITFEAEEHDTRGERWIPTVADTPTQDYDPDDNHSASASGGAYLELLPDYRTHHGSEPGPEPSFWGTAGYGPMLGYTIDFPEAGRYYVHVRALTTGTEDNGIHVGLNGEWPVNGERVQICTDPDAGWRWTSNQRDTGGSACGVRGTIWLDVPSVGNHTVTFSAREDGFEIDRIVLLKDRSKNTRRCGPALLEEGRIECQDGQYDAEEDGFVDLALSLEADLTTIGVGDRLTVTASTGNRDFHDTANNVTLDLAFDTDALAPVALDGMCEITAQGVRCSRPALPPTGGSAISQDITLEARQEGAHDIAASVEATEPDDSPDNDTAALRIDVSAEAPDPTQLLLTVNPAIATTSEAERIEFEARVANTGEAAAIGTVLTLAMDAALVLASVPNDCHLVEAGLECAVQALDAGGATAVAFELYANGTGEHAFQVTIDADNAPSSSTEGTLVVAAEVVTPVEPEPDATEETESTGGSAKRSSNGLGATGPLLLALGALAWRRRLAGKRVPQT